MTQMKRIVFGVFVQRGWIELKGKADAGQWGAVEHSQFLNTFHDPRPPCAGLERRVACLDSIFDFVPVDTRLVRLVR